MAERGSRAPLCCPEVLPQRGGRLYSLQFAALCPGWLAIEDMLEVNRYRLLTAFLFAFAVGMFHY